MRATIWGCRGSLATPGPATVRYGGNTTSVELRSQEGRVIVLDAGTGVRPLGLTLAASDVRQIDLVLTHLHLDHVEGLGFFALLFDPSCTVTIWGPPQPGSSLAERIEGYLSPPFFPVPYERLPARIEIREIQDERWSIGDVDFTARTVQHPGSTFGYRIENAGRTLAFIPDNELGADPSSGVELAAGADVLIHDAQYTQDEYRSRIGWGHSSVEDFAAFVAETSPGQALMFHHDPAHSDEFLETMRERAREITGLDISLAAEGSIL
jgi:phosphoribosyl 1,2-cyclic phosphodiesterase